MADICDKTLFPPMKYFEQHELRPGKPDGYAYDYTRVLRIYAEATTSGLALDTLNTIMEEVYDDGDYPGVKSIEKTWKIVVRDFLKTQRPFVPANPFDLKLWKTSRIVIFLDGEFWEFSPTLSPITTKYDYGDNYFDPRRHGLDGNDDLINAMEDEWKNNWGKKMPSKCISFFTPPPCPYEYSVSHGFSLNVELVTPQKDRLPITIDPDIENKGGGHP